MTCDPLPTERVEWRHGPYRLTLAEQAALEEYTRLWNQLDAMSENDPKADDLADRMDAPWIALGVAGREAFRNRDKEPKTGCNGASGEVRN